VTNPLLIPELRELIAASNTEAVRELCMQTHPGAVAELLAGLETSEIWQVLHMLDVPSRAEIFSHFNLDRQVELVSGENRADMARLLEEMPPDDRADLIRRLDESLCEEILPLVAKAEREDIRRLAQYEEGTAGAVMSSDYAVVKPEISAQQAIEQLRRQAPSKETIYYAYVVDAHRKLAGFVSLKDLILARPGQLIQDIMHADVIKAHVSDDQEIVARQIEKFDLLAIPVVDGNEVLVGIVTHDDALDIIRQEQTEDMEKLMAIGGRHQFGDYLKTSAVQHFRKRVSWIVGLAALGLVSGIIIHGFEDTLMSLMILALYMPMMADTGGNTGSQSATVVVRALALGEISAKDILRVMRKELFVSLLLAIILGVLAFGKVLFLSQNTAIPGGYTLTRIGFAIAVALALQVVTATLIGALLPLIASAFKLDPAVVASPALTTVVDITGLLIYFTTARILLSL